MEVRDDALVKVVHLLEMVSNWRAFLNDLQNVDADRLRRHERTGRPLGQESFIEHLEVEFSRTLRPKKPGPKKQIK